MKKIELICMTFDGNYVVDSEHETMEQAYYAAENLGSKWFFFPFLFFVKGQTIKEAGGQLVAKDDGEVYMDKLFKGKRLKTAANMLKKSSEQEQTAGMDSLQFEIFLIHKFSNL